MIVKLISLVSTLAMSDELAQDEADAEDYDLSALERRGPGSGREEDDDAATLVEHPGRVRPSAGSGAGEHRARTVEEDAVVFEVGEHEMSDDDDDDRNKTSNTEARTRDHPEAGEESERQGLISAAGRKDKDE